MPEVLSTPPKAYMEESSKEAIEIMRRTFGMMTEAEKILKLIESVKPDDTDTLDEIDARVWCWLNGFKYVGREDDWTIYENPAYACRIHNGESKTIADFYTRSRDALKAIRPENYIISLVPWTNNGRDVGSYSVTILPYPDKDMPILVGEAPTEELAELHAIIQAIAYERKSDE